MSKFAAIIPAAGLSSRMKRFKPLLPLGDGTVLSQCVDLFRANHIEQVIVVTGKRANDVAHAATRAGATPVHNHDFEHGMYSSVLTGVSALPDDVSAFFMLPADIPLVRRETVHRLIHEFQRTTPAILYPRFKAERGHPPLISREVLPAILAHDGTGGLRAVLEQFETRSHDMDVADFGTIHDLDHPTDYQLAQSLVKTGYPIRQECEMLWDMYAVSPNIRAHCQAVTRVAEALHHALDAQREKPGKLNLALIRGAALVHDLAKGKKHHERVEAKWLQSHGFHDAATIVATHSDLTLGPNEPITEREIVFLADKFVHEDAFTELKTRYQTKLDRFGHIPDAKKNILERLQRAQEVCARCDQETGKSMEQLAQQVLA